MKLIFKIIFSYIILTSNVYSQNGRTLITNGYSVSGTITQIINVDNDKNITIRCNCSTRSVKQGNENKTLKLIIHGTDSSGGYNRKQNIPDVVSPEKLRFIERRIDGEIVLESKEYTFIHHAFIIDKLQIIAPSDMTIKIEPIPYLSLEGRKVNE